MIACAYSDTQWDWADKADLRFQELLAVSIPPNPRRLVVGEVGRIDV